MSSKERSLVREMVEKSLWLGAFGTSLYVLGWALTAKKWLVAGVAVAATIGSVRALRER